MSAPIEADDLTRAVRYIRIGLPDFAPDVAKALGIVCGALEQAANDAREREIKEDERFKEEYEAGSVKGVDHA